MLHFEGAQDFPHSPAELWAQLSDLRFLSRCIPGLESAARVEPDLLICTLRPGVSFMRGTLEVTLRVVEAINPASIRFHVHGKGIGSSNDVEAVLTILALAAGTKVHWSAEVKAMTGLLKMVPRGLIQASAQKVIDEVWKAIGAKLGDERRGANPT